MALILAGVAWVVLHRDSIGVAQLQSTIDGLGVWAPIAFVGLYAIGTIVASATNAGLTSSGRRVFIGFSFPVVDRPNANAKPPASK